MSTTMENPFHEKARPIIIIQYHVIIRGIEVKAMRIIIVGKNIVMGMIMWEDILRGR
jgi:hypothetical protein